MPAEDRVLGSVATTEAVEGKADDKAKDEAKDSNSVGGIKNPKKSADASQPASPDKAKQNLATLSSSLNQQMLQHGFMNPAMMNPANAQVGMAGIGANPLWGFGGYAGPMLFPGAPGGQLMTASGMAALGAMHQQVD